MTLGVAPYRHYLAHGAALTPVAAEMSTISARNLVGRLPRISEPVLARDRVWSALDSSQPLTILRAARGFGKTTVLVTWLRRYRGAVPSVYVPLDSHSNDQAEFWTTLARELNDAGVELDGTSEDTRDRLIAGLSRFPTPLRLVLDNFDEAGLLSGAAQIDDDLADLVRGNDQLYLVVAGRSLRALESIGSLSVEATVIGPDDLRFSDADILRLSDLRDARMSEHEASRINEELDGWPAAIRAGLRNVTPDGHLDESLIDGYIAAVVRDERFDAWRPFMLRTSVPERFDSELLRTIAPEAWQDGPRVSSGEMLTWLRATGLLREVRGEERTFYSYAPRVRTALLRLTRETEPQLEGDVHRALIASPGMHNVPGKSLLHATHAGEWSTVLALMERQWLRLLTDNPDSLLEAIRRMPPEFANGDPRVRVAREHLGELLRRISSFSPWTIQEGLLTNSDLLADTSQIEQPEGQDAVVLLQWGVASLMSGNHDAATFAFSKARDLGLSHSETAARMGTAGLGIVYALAGEPDLARTWLEHPDLEIIRQSGDETDITAVTVSIARALVAVDVGDPDARALVDSMFEPRHRADLWMVGEFVRAHHAAFGDDPEEVFRQANKVRAALRHVARGALSETVLQSALVELLVVARMVGVAGEVAAQLPEDPIGWTAHAKVHLARHDFTQAAEYSKRAIADPGGSRRTHLEATVVLASALHALEADDEAQDAFRNAVRLARATGLRRPFFLMHQYVFDILAEQVNEAQGLWPGNIGESGAAQTDEHTELPTLTMREAQILRALERHTGPVGIGRALNLSANTVKTHLRSVYRKLGAANRSQALEAVSRGRPRTTNEQ